jgi:hypothetical protein
MSAYVSCNCIACRHVPSKIKGWHKRQAHRILRRRVRAALHNADFDGIPDQVSTGYKG